MTRPTVLLIIVVLALEAVARGHAGQERKTFRAAADAVLIDVSVTDGNSPIADLIPADFQVQDNGVMQTVTDLDVDHLPIDVRVVVDISSSVRGLLAAYERAIGQLGAALRPGDRCEVLAFALRLVEVRPLSEPPVDIHIDRTVREPTAFFDTVARAMVTTPRPGRRQLTIILSDGWDNSSFYDAPALIRAAQRTDAVVYAIIPGSQGVKIIPWGNAALLETLTTAAGGGVIRLEASGDIGASFRKLFEDFRRSYVLYYTPQGVERTGWHELTVNVRGDRKYTIRAKKGYDGGAAEHAAARRHSGRARRQ